MDAGSTPAISSYIKIRPRCQNIVISILYIYLNFSGLLLGNSEILTVKDIKDLIINSNTIILSACESGLGTINNSNEIIGLAQAFLNTGVRTIIVSLWKIDSAATEKFMETFIHYLKHWDKITALQKQ